MHSDRLLRRDGVFLMVIDVQQPLMQIIWERERTLGNILLLMRAAHILGIPTIVTAQNRERLGDLCPEVLDAASPGHPVLNKITFSCMRDGSIANAVDRLGRRQALLCGVETHVCVHQTAADLLAAGYEVHVAADAVSSRRELNWEMGLRRMERAGVTVTTAEMALYEIMERAGTPEFREVLRLVR